LSYASILHKKTSTF